MRNAFTKISIATVFLATAAFPAMAQQPLAAMPVSTEQMRDGQLTQDPELNGQSNIDQMKQMKDASGLPSPQAVKAIDGRINHLNAEADKKLDELIGAANSSEADRSAIAAQQNTKLSIREYEDKVTLAKKMAEYWQVLGIESGVDEDQLKKLESENEKLKASLQQLQSQQSGQGNHASSTPDPNPVIAEITGASGKVRAKVLVPYMGAFVVKVGDTLPNGQKVLSINADGVSVQSQSGQKIPLAYGTSVPLTRAAPVSNLQQRYGS